MNAIDDIDPGDEPDEDLQAVLDEQPCQPAKRGPKPKYKPGTRQEQLSREVAAGAGSWWMTPDADFAGEAQRMRDKPTRLKVPGEFNVIGWKAAF